MTKIQWINTETSLLEQLGLELEDGCWYHFVVVWEDANHCRVGLTKVDSGCAGEVLDQS